MPVVKKMHFTNCTARDNGGNGFHVEGAETKNAVFNGCLAERNKGHGFIGITNPAAMRELGLPEGTNPQPLVELLQVLQKSKPEERHAIASQEGWLKKVFANIQATTDTIDKIVKLAASNDLQAILTKLWP